MVIIPARGKSKRLPRKNVRLLDGKPLLAYSIEHARRSRLVNRIIVTTDDDEIAQVSVNYGAEVLRRPSALADDVTTSEATLIHVLESLKRDEQYQPDMIVFLQCTSPIRRQGDIDNAISKFVETQADSLFSAFRFRKYIWEKEGNRLRPINYDYENRLLEQVFPEQYQENGSIYVIKPDVLLKDNNRLGGKIVMYEMDYWSFIQIDTAEDFQLCEQIMKVCLEACGI